MIIRQMYCPKCGKNYDLVFESIEDFSAKKNSNSLVCEDDGEILKQRFSLNIIIPDYMRATHEESKTYDYAKNLMSKASRPSGREKIFF